MVKQYDYFLGNEKVLIYTTNDIITHIAGSNDLVWVSSFIGIELNELKEMTFKGTKFAKLIKEY